MAGALAPGSVLLLEGDLGAGKSELARAVIRARAGADIPVPSPTFTLLQSYALPGIDIAHCDLYRLRGEDEVVELGLEECWRHGALIVEWPDRAGDLWPRERLRIVLDQPSPDAPDLRRARLQGTGRWSTFVERLAAGGHNG